MMHGSTYVKPKPRT